MKVLESDKPPLGARISCWLTLNSPNGLLGCYDRTNKAIWIRSGLPASTREYVLQHEIGHSKQNWDWLDFVKYWVAVRLPIFIVWAAFSMLRFPVWLRITVLLTGFFIMPLELHYILPYFKRKSEELADKYAEQIGEHW